MRFLLVSVFLTIAAASQAQKVDSIYFHLYTDSLKRGQHNYINVDGKLSNGSWLPMTAKQVDFSSSHGQFEGNELIIPENFTEKKVTVKAVLKSNPSVVIERTIWIKTMPDPPLPRYESDNRGRGRNKN